MPFMPSKHEYFPNTSEVLEHICAKCASHFYQHLTHFVVLSGLCNRDTLEEISVSFGRTYTP